MRALQKDREKRQQIGARVLRGADHRRAAPVDAGARASSASFPEAGASGTPAMPMSSMPNTERAGKTQVGEPIFKDEVPQPAGRTLVDQTAARGPVRGRSAVPTGGGQAVPARRPAAKKGGPGMIIAGRRGGRGHRGGRRGDRPKGQKGGGRRGRRDNRAAGLRLRGGRGGRSPPRRPTTAGACGRADGGKACRSGDRDR